MKEYLYIIFIPLIVGTALTFCFFKPYKGHFYISKCVFEKVLFNEKTCTAKTHYKICVSVKFRKSIWDSLPRCTVWSNCVTVNSKETLDIALKNLLKEAKEIERKYENSYNNKLE